MGERVSGEAWHLHIDEHGAGRGGEGMEDLEGFFSGFECFGFESGFGGKEDNDLPAHHVVIDYKDAGLAQCTHAPQNISPRGVCESRREGTGTCGVSFRAMRQSGRVSRDAHSRR